MVLSDKSLQIQTSVNENMHGAKKVNLTFYDGWMSIFKNVQGYTLFALMASLAMPTVLQLQTVSKTLRRKYRDMKLATCTMPTNVNSITLCRRTALLPGVYFREEKKPKEHSRRLVCSSADGSDKIEFMIVGNATKPRAFKNTANLILALITTTRRRPG